MTEMGLIFKVQCLDGTVNTFNAHAKRRSLLRPKLERIVMCVNYRFLIICKSQQGQ